MSGEGKWKGKTSETTPAKGTRQYPRTKKSVHPEAVDTASELYNSAEKLLTDKIDTRLPGFYEELKLPKSLYDLAESIQKSSNGTVLGNKDVQKNFEEVQQIFQGWATPVTTPDRKSKIRKRKCLDDQNRDETMKSVEITELQENAKKLKDDLTKQLEEKAILIKENRVKENVIEKLKENYRKLEQDLNNHKETIACIATEKHGEIETKKRTMEIEFLEAYLRKAHSEITKLKETIEEKEKKFLADQNAHKRTNNEDKYEKTVAKDGEEQVPHEKDTKSEELLHELKTVLNKLIEEEKAHQKTKKDEKLERENLQKLKEELLYDKDTLTHELTKVKTEIKQKHKELESIGNELIKSNDFNERKSLECEALIYKFSQMQNELKQKNVELESIGNDLIKSSDFNERKSRECEALIDQFARMQNELKQKNEELNDLRKRSSSSKLDGDSNITDLVDPNRPSKLEERYLQLYDNLWTDIFDELTDSYNDVDDSSEREKMAAIEIMSIFERVLQFCKQLVEDQEKTIISSLTFCPQDNLDKNASSIYISTIRNMRRSNAQKTLPFIVQLYARKNVQELTGFMKDFAEECIAICWLTQVQDPPMAFEFNYDHGVQLDKDLMREFTVSGDIVDYVIWPTMRLTLDGPVMVKSVVQPIKKKTFNLK